MSDYQGFLLSKWKWQRKFLQFLSNSITFIVCMVLPVTLSSGIQLWTVPRNGEYRIEAIGASGGYGEDSIIKTGGRGARVIGNFNLTKGEAIGASGGYGEDSIIKTEGRGAQVIGNFNLTKGH